jgi:hypothetical protein
VDTVIRPTKQASDNMVTAFLISQSPTYVTEGERAQHVLAMVNQWERHWWKANSNWRSHSKTESAGGALPA